MNRLKLVPVTLGIVLALSTAACAAPQPAPTTPAPAAVVDLSLGISPRAVAAAPVDDAFTAAIAAFSVALLQRVATGQENYLTSSLSAELALAMTANGAGGQTLAQMEQVLAQGLTIDQLNAILPGYVRDLPSTDGAKFHLGNSLWVNDADNVNIEHDFLQTNANYYQAGTYRVPFDASGLEAINTWVRDKTDGMIPSMLDRLDGSRTALFLVNALAFDALWQDPYDGYQIHDGFFENAAGEQASATYMSSSEYGYLDDNMATGFTKPYDNGRYEFVALLPNQGVSMDAYLASLTGDKWISTLSHPKQASVSVDLPEFSFSYEASLKDQLIAMGMPDGFDQDTADFAKMGTMNGKPLFIADVKQKTFIDVTPSGTRAGGATAVQIDGSTAPAPSSLRFDRPFVFGIVDSNTKLPLFLGVLNQLG